MSSSSAAEVAAFTRSQLTRFDDYRVAVIEGSFTLQNAHLPPDAGPVLQAYADAFEEVWEHMELLTRYAADMAYRPPRGPSRTGETKRGEDEHDQTHGGAGAGGGGVHRPAAA